MLYALILFTENTFENTYRCDDGTTESYPGESVSIAFLSFPLRVI